MKISGVFRILPRPLSRALSIRGHIPLRDGGRRGNTSKALSASQFVVFAQNHDQVGNRLKGDRLSGFGHLRRAEAGGCSSCSFRLSYPDLHGRRVRGKSAVFPCWSASRTPDLIAAVNSGREQEFAYLQETDEPPDLRKKRPGRAQRVITACGIGGSIASCTNCTRNS